ncbi:MAG TPA: hypothetical protein VGI86_21590 [Acidimicrobiia bacterium]|jgi:hypothetical protein
MSDRVATALWHTAPALLLALDERLGVPVDSYVNGSQTWLTPDGPEVSGESEVMLEWRLHPVAHYATPRGASHYDVWELVIAALSAGSSGDDAIEIGDERRRIDELWGGLECFAAYDDDVEPGPLATAAGTALGIAPDRFGLVDHQAIGDAWEQSHGAVDIASLLSDALSG